MAETVASGPEAAPNEVAIAPVDDLPETAKGVAAEARDLKALRSAVVDTAAVTGALWVSYLFVLFYLLVAVGAVTHRDLFFEHGVKLPFLSVDLPLTGFFALGPLIFLIVHAYVFLHFVLLAGKVGEFDRELRTQIPDEETRTRVRRQLPSNIFVQFLAGPREVRAGVTGLMLKLIAWISLVIGPVVLLVFVQLRFLPYHNEAITWWQRITVLIEIVMLWTLWPAVARGETVRAPWRGLRLRAIPAIAVSVLVLVLCFGIATFPGEWLHATLPSVRFVPASLAETLAGQVRKTGSEDEEAEQNRARSLHELLMAGDLDEVARQPTSPFSNVLLLPNIDAVDRSRFDDDAKFAAVRETISLRGRRLEGAVLLDANLRKADLTGARLQGARLERADLRDASLSCAHRQAGQFGWNDRDCAQLQEASLTEARLEGALLDHARLQGAVLSDARLQGASLVEAQLQGARLDRALLLGAKLDGANLQGSSLFLAQLDGTTLEGAMLETAILGNASFAGASLREARLKGTDLNNALLAGGNLEGADLTGGIIRYLTPICR